MWPIVLVALAAVVLNLPMGYWRASTRKFTWQWFLAIHLPIPLIFLLRQGMGLSMGFIPLMFACAIVGQLAGGRVRSRSVRTWHAEGSGGRQTSRN